MRVISKEPTQIATQQRLSSRKGLTKRAEYGLAKRVRVARVSERLNTKGITKSVRTIMRRREQRRA